MIKYLGSKRLLIPAIRRLVGAVPGAVTVCDPFSGTARVGHALKRDGFVVHANDINSYATVLARCFVEADRAAVLDDAESLLGELSRVEPRAGWFTREYCELARFFRPENGARIEAVRESIARMQLEPVLESVLLTALMLAADRVDSTCGVQMAFLKTWAPRALEPIRLRMPDLLPAVHGACSAHCGEAVDFVRGRAVDVAYLDPPYNQHSYLGNYHVWETLVRWDRPECYGIARKRADCRERRSDFNSKRACRDAFAKVLAQVDARVIVVSFSDEGHMSRDEIVSMLATRGEVHVYSTGFKRYVGAQIGIHDPRGVRVGEVSHLHNREMLFLVDVGGTGVDWSAIDPFAATADRGATSVNGATSTTRSGRAARRASGRASPRRASPADSPP